MREKERELRFSSFFPKKLLDLKKKQTFKSSFFYKENKHRVVCALNFNCSLRDREREKKLNKYLLFLLLLASRREEKKTAPLEIPRLLLLLNNMNKLQKKAFISS